MQITAMA